MATDGTNVPRRTVLFIKETVGIAGPDERLHGGYWYATDVELGHRARPHRPLYRPAGRDTLAPLMQFNLRRP